MSQQSAMSQQDEREGRRAAWRQEHERGRKQRTMMMAVLGVVVVGVLALVAVLVSGAFSGGGTANVSAAPTGWSAEAYSGGPRLAVDRTAVDDGSVSYSHEVKATYTLKNVGDQQLTLQKASVEALEGC